MRLPLVPEDISRAAVMTKARSGVQIATALASTARGAAPALLKEVPHLVGTVAGTAWGAGSALLQRVLPDETFAPDLGRHQASDVESERDAALQGPATAAQPVSAPVPEEAAEVGAPGTAAEAVDKAARQVASSEDFVSGAVLTHDELPLADFDHLTIGALRNKIRPLGMTELIQLREWERAHADRLPVITALENRIAKLQAEQADSGKPQPSA